MLSELSSASDETDASSTHYRCLAEPEGLLRQFLRHPPAGFDAYVSPEGVVGFHTRFDLLTTADAALIEFFDSLPSATWLRQLLRLRTCFFGSTVNEYAPLPSAFSPVELTRAMLAIWAKDSPLMIVKDIAEASPLLPQQDSDYAAAFLVACEAAGFILVDGQALAYVPIDFVSEEAYLARLSAGRRKDIRRKLRARDVLRIERLPTGSARLVDDQLLTHLYALYLKVYEQSELHFDILGAAFFSSVLRDETLDGHIFLYSVGEYLIGFNLCFVHAGMLVDKYIGLDYPAARDYNLYVVSWMENLAYAREQGLNYYVAGWTDPEIKAYLGARFTFTRHAVYVRNPLLRAVLRKLVHRFQSDHAWFEQYADKPATHS